jgi:hypothetical protein
MTLKVRLVVGILVVAAVAAVATGAGACPGGSLVPCDSAYATMVQQ